ncbi:MAG: leucine--tRNA ligase [Candidatus Curtissbacteria bacterium]|nr:leucine--tRNA ligase [Candidatus Curtissbacteria bacterium]
MKKYIPKEVEAKWQKEWEAAKIYEAKDSSSNAKKYYVLDMFPYPSGDGLHVGHFKGYTATDVISRFLRAKGFNVLHPMGWDAFGLPAENYAIQTGINPAISTAKNIDHIRAQMKMVGLSYDWGREINTTDPDYYRWTQWIFLQLYKKGLAYEAEAPINWCPKDKTGLANEEVVNGLCDRCGTKVVRKKIRQWILAITKYADRLLEDLEGLDWPQSIVEMQRNWIGRSEGAMIRFTVDSLPAARLPAGQGEAGSQLIVQRKSVNRKPITDNSIEVFTTRADTLFGATFLVLAPEHALVAKITTRDKQKEVEDYVKKTEQKTDLERTDLTKVKTGVFTGAYAANPINNEKIPIWIADFVIGSYGTGAVFADAHDERDFEFAKKYGILLKPSLLSGDAKRDDRIKNLEECFTGYGILFDSGEFSGLTSEEARKKIVESLEKQGKGGFRVSYKLRDWIFSRQRYWGEPIPIVHCPKCGTVPLPEEDLPLLLPEVEKYQPTGTGESPLASVSDWVNTTCPNCGGSAKRETNTMPQWAGSCWYYLRFVDPKNNGALVDLSKEKYWMGKTDTNEIGGVDWYVGGAEHAVLHLLYARFWHKFLFDIKVVSEREPFYKLRNVGLILGPDGQKMSKSKGNVISPEEMVKSYGADTLRVFEMFIGPFGDVADWNPRAVEGVYRFLQRVWLFSHQIIESKKSKSDDDLVRAVNRLIAKAERDIWEMKFNTTVAAMMEFVNGLSQNIDKAGTDVLENFLLVLTPFAPHMTEEIWSHFAPEGASRDKQDWSIHQQPWPEYDEALARASMVTIVIQVNGKVRDRLLVEAGTDQKTAEKLALESAKVTKFLGNAKPQRIIFVPDRLVNLVI